MRVHLPLQQGLRRDEQISKQDELDKSASASSITTRIKTRQR